MLSPDEVGELVDQIVGKDGGGKDWEGILGRVLGIPQGGDVLGGKVSLIPRGERDGTDGGGDRYWTGETGELDGQEQSSTH